LVRDALGRTDLGDQLVATTLEHLGDAVKDLAAVVRRALRPATERLAGGGDGVAAVLARGLRGVGQEAALRVGDLVGAAGLRAGEGPTDEQLVRLADVESITHAATSGRRAGYAGAGIDWI